MRHLYVVEEEDLLDTFDEGGMVGKGGRQRRCCAVNLSVELSSCYFVDIVEFMFDVLHDACDSMGRMPILQEIDMILFTI